jgi:hypothetical protein
MKIILGGFNTKVSREDTFKPAIKNENLHEISHNNAVRVVNFPHRKILLLKYDVPIP